PGDQASSRRAVAEKGPADAGRLEAAARMPERRADGQDRAALACREHSRGGGCRQSRRRSPASARWHHRPRPGPGPAGQG
nr:hypothetical protein [Tanacetum cinerariifolium]